MEGILQGQGKPVAAYDAFAKSSAEQVGFEEAIALVKKHQGAILIRTKNGHCMVRLANGNVLAVTPPTEPARSTHDGSGTSQTILQQEVDRLGRAILMNKNVLDKARHHLREKDLEIRQLKAKLEEQEQEIAIKNKIISSRGKQIEKLKEDLQALNMRQGNAPGSAVSVVGGPPC